MRKQVGVLLFTLLLLLIVHRVSVARENNTSLLQDATLLNSLQLQGTEVQKEPPKTSFKLFTQDLGHNFVGLFSKQNLAPFLAGAAVAGFSRTTLDEEVQEHFSIGNTHDFFADTGATIGEAYVLAPTVFALFIAGQHSGDTRFRSFSYALAQGYVLNGGMVLALKYATERDRPDGSNALSFPSGHSSDLFMIATVVDRYYGHKAGFLTYGLAGFVAASRLKKNVHWVSDVVAGGVLGYIVGRTVSRDALGIPVGKKFSIVPAVDPFQKGYGVALQLNLP